MTEIEREMLIEGLSACCEAPVIIGDICTQCHNHCTVRHETSIDCAAAGCADCMDGIAGDYL